MDRKKQKFDEDERYISLLEYIRSRIVAVSKDLDEPYSAIMLVCDLSAEVIVSTVLQEDWDAAIRMFINRLENTMDRHAKKDIEGK